MGGEVGRKGNNVVTGWLSRFSLNVVFCVLVRCIQWHQSVFCVVRFHSSFFFFFFFFLFFIRNIIVTEMRLCKQYLIWPVSLYFASISNSLLKGKTFWNIIGAQRPVCTVTEIVRKTIFFLDFYCKKGAVPAPHRIPLHQRLLPLLCVCAFFRKRPRWKQPTAGDESSSRWKAKEIDGRCMAWSSRGRTKPEERTSRKQVGWLGGWVGCKPVEKKEFKRSAEALIRSKVERMTPSVG